MVSAMQTTRSERRRSLGTGAGGCARCAPVGASARGQTLRILVAPAKHGHPAASPGSPPAWAPLPVTQWPSGPLVQREFLSKTQGNIAVPAEAATQDVSPWGLCCNIFRRAAGLEERNQEQVNGEGDGSNAHISPLNNFPFPCHAWQ